MPKLNILTQVVATVDDAGTQKAPDWKRVVEFPAEQVLVERAILAPGASRVFLSDSGAHQYLPAGEGAPVFTLVEHPSKEGLVQFRSPAAFAFAVLEGVNGVHEVTAVGDGTIFFESGASYAWSVGTVIYLPGAKYGDAGPWADANQGFWQVVSRSAGRHLMRRGDGEVATLGASESVTVTAAEQVQFVQAPGYLYVQGSPYSGVFEVVEAARDWVTVRPLAVVEDDAPAIDFLATASCYALYARVEADREVEVHYQTADTADVQHPRFFPVLPVTPGDPKNIGWAEARSFFTDLSVKNVSDQKAAVSVILALPKSGAVGG